MSLLALRERHRKAGGEDEVFLLKHFGRHKFDQGISNIGMESLYRSFVM